METDLYPTKKTEMKVRKKTTAEIEIEMKSKRLKIVWYIRMRDTSHTSDEWAFFCEKQKYTKYQTHDASGIKYSQFGFK